VSGKVETYSSGSVEWVVYGSVDQEFGFITGARKCLTGFENHTIRKAVSSTREG
jgi:hypothetical protein